MNSACSLLDVPGIRVVSGVRWRIRRCLECADRVLRFRAGGPQHGGVFTDTRPTGACTASRTPLEPQAWACGEIRSRWRLGSGGE